MSQLNSKRFSRNVFIHLSCSPPLEVWPKYPAAPRQSARWAAAAVRLTYICSSAGRCFQQERMCRCLQIQNHTQNIIHPVSFFPEMSRFLNLLLYFGETQRAVLEQRLPTKICWFKRKICKKCLLKVSRDGHFSTNISLLLGTWMQTWGLPPL